MKRRSAAAALAILAGLRAPSAWAQPKPGSGAKAGDGGFTEGRDYDRLDPAQPTHSPGKIEVIEFFSYACPHCAAFEPVLEAWIKRLPADVAFRRVPTPILFNVENFMRTYYALEQLGLVAKMQPLVFAAVHVDKLRLDKPEDIAALVAKNGGDGAKFLAAFKSFSVVTSVGRARQMTVDYRLSGVPSLAIAGLYSTSPEQAKGTERSLAVTDALVDRVRKSGRR